MIAEWYLIVLICISLLTSEDGQVFWPFRFLFCELPAYTFPIFLIGLLAFFLCVYMFLIYSGSFATWRNYKHLILRTVFWCTDFILMYLSVVSFMVSSRAVMFLKSFPALRLYIHLYKNCSFALFRSLYDAKSSGYKNSISCLFL